MSQTPTFWVEKTLVSNRIDRQTGLYSLGKAVWSPQRANGKTKRDIYWQMREIKKGDIIFHFIDNKVLDSYSIAAENVDDTFKGVDGTDWSNRPSYLIRLTNHTKIIPSIHRDDFLQNKKYIKIIDELLNNEKGLFFRKDYNLNQGSYITKAPIKLVKIWNDIHLSKTNKPINNVWSLNNESSSVKVISNISKLKPNLLVHKANADLTKSNYIVNKGMLARFIASLITKPFVILTGLSGSGKTKLAQIFANWISENDNQFCIIPVGADWTNREPLLGFQNVLKESEYVKPDNKVLDLLIAANQNKEKPYFVILDEMNLSHVERYFADFLSVMETGKSISLHHGKEDWNGVPPEITLPKNLFIVGTVNIDETTYMFSPKVLDRANVIEFRVTQDEMKKYLDGSSMLDLESLESAGAGMATSFVEIALNQTLQPTNGDVIKSELMHFFTELKKTGAEFGYRSASEILRFAAVVNTIEPGMTYADIVDAAIMQKLLPKVHGSRRKLEPVLKTLGSLCLQSSENIDEYITAKNEIDFSDSSKIKYPLSLEKILRMNRSLIDNSFTSFAEA